jgi:FHA domain
MRSTWSPILALLAVGAALLPVDAALQACAAASLLELTPALDAAGTFAAGPHATGATTIFATAAGTSGDAFAQFGQWVLDNYARAPALMLGLAVLLAVPTLALAGRFVRRSHQSPDATVLISRPSRRGQRSEPEVPRTQVSAWPTQAWVEAVGPPGGKWVIGRTLLRIGREEDNDICLSTNTVHRYHAVIRRTTDGEVVITDTSGADGNGVLVNGTSVAEARLAKGDKITVGTVELRFDARPV